MAYRTSAQVISDIVKVNLDVISNGYDHPDDNTVEFYYTNADWCDYYLVRIGDDSYVLPPGKTVIQRYSRSTPSAEVKQPGTYRPYKGIPVENLDIRFPYALPVKAGTEVTLLRDTRERVRSFVVLMKPGEPVCAMRGGRVCLNDVKGSQIIVSTMFDRIGDGGVREIVRCVRDGMTFAKAVELRYPGGKEGLERDIVEFVHAR